MRISKGQVIRKYREKNKMSQKNLETNLELVLK